MSRTRAYSSVEVINVCGNLEFGMQLQKGIDYFVQKSLLVFFVRNNNNISPCEYVCKGMLTFE